MLSVSVRVGDCGAVVPFASTVAPSLRLILPLVSASCTNSILRNNVERSLLFASLAWMSSHIALLGSKSPAKQPTEQLSGCCTFEQASFRTRPQYDFLRAIKKQSKMEVFAQGGNVRLASQKFTPE